MEALWLFLYETSYAEMVRYSMWGYPIFETLHLIGVALLFGSIVLTDLRMLGLGKHLSATELAGRYLLRLTWVGFALVAFSGFSLFVAYAEDNVQNPFFVLKMVLIAVAGINALFFHVRVYSGVAGWNLNGAAPLAGKISTALSMTLWTLTIAAGRLIAYPELFWF